jgi:hypothetical protein
MGSQISFYSESTPSQSQPSSEEPSKEDKKAFQTAMNGKDGDEDGNTDDNTSFSTLYASSKSTGGNSGNSGDSSSKGSSGDSSSKGNTGNSSSDSGSGANSGGCSLSWSYKTDTSGKSSAEFGVDIEGSSGESKVRVAVGGTHDPDKQEGKRESGYIKITGTKKIKKYPPFCFISTVTQQSEGSGSTGDSSSKGSTGDISGKASTGDSC